MGGATLISRREHFPVVGSTNDIVAAWLSEGIPEICLAVADEQAKGRGREGRTWRAPAGAGLLMSLGFRPTWIQPERVWRIAAVISLSMAEAAERLTRVDPGTILLKWPNDLVAFGDAGAPRKLAGVLGETAGLGTDDPRVVVGIGTNVDWSRAEFPPEIADGMTSVRELAGGDRRVDSGDLLERFLAVLEPRIEQLRDGHFDAGEWQRRQLTSGLPVRLELADGREEVVQAQRVDPQTGGLVVESGGVERTIMAGEIHHLRVITPTQPRTPARV